MEELNTSFSEKILITESLKEDGKNVEIKAFKEKILLQKINTEISNTEKTLQVSLIKKVYSVNHTR